MQQHWFAWTILVGTLLIGQLATSSAYAQGARPAPAGVPAPAGANGASANFAKQVNNDSIDLAAVAKTALLATFFLIWIKTGDWVNYDSQVFSTGYRKWNSIIFFPICLLALGFFFFPVPFYIRFPVLLVVWLATLIPYIVVHNRKVEPHQTVFTGPWFRYEIATLANKVGVKISSERKAAHELGAAVDLLALGADDANQDNTNLLTARQSPGYVLAKDLIAELASRNADSARLDYTPQAVNVRHEIDGVWHNGEARDRESGDVLLAVMKTLANLDTKERRRKQEGHFGAKFEGSSYLCPLVCQGTKNGERVLLSLEYDKKDLKTYDDLGMREGLQKQWAEFMAREQGLVMLSSLPDGGLTTVTDISLEETDRLMRDFVAIEEASQRNREIQNVSITTYDAAAGQTPDSILPELIRTYPNVYVIRDIVNRATAKLLFREIRDEHLVITTVRARDASEALLRILQKKVPSEDFAALVTAVLYQRLVRLLCPDCKVGYKPSPDVLKKLGIPEGKIQQLYRPPKPEEIDKPCTKCRGLSYRGRTGIFELLEVTDQMREILVKQPKADLLRKAGKASRQRSLQEEGILLVAKGVTSLPELMRVLKQ